MKLWWVMFRKEWKEMMKSYKLLWMPVAFALLGMIQPLTSYYMSDILRYFGDLPEGTTFDIPMPTASEVMVSTLSGQFNQVGMLILVMASMGLVASERSAGIASMLLVKPISYASYVTSKWAGGLALTWLSFGLGYLSCWYYTTLLFGDLPTAASIQAFLLYGLWLSFICTVTTAFSTLLKNSGAVAAVSLLIVIAVAGGTSILPGWMSWSPARHLDHSISVLTEGTVGSHFLLSLVSTAGVMIALMALAILMFRRKELVE
ncbi:ABC transporter permease subunit [Kroppenstedtia pulmonis]|uniref:ABC transporter permease subunit n=1 Tax=Kroppenstedtia pulmonis TaxID=1380685 RepID=A0A7D4CW32_9BACL|nr:ABC transporter permease subunit [Kroppenstedtia pulmonis]QKG84717.1 ABC transporter permease subunit [Kroppenstedtia pulmonis]